MLVNAIFWPSGDHAGSFSARSPWPVMLAWPEPSAFMTKIATVPFRELPKAIFSPSADQLGLMSSTAALLLRLAIPEPSSLMPKTSRLLMPFVKMILPLAPGKAALAGSVAAIAARPRSAQRSTRVRREACDPIGRLDTGTSALANGPHRVPMAYRPAQPYGRLEPGKPARDGARISKASWI